MDKKVIFTLIMGLTLFACSSEPEWKLLGTYQVPDTEVIPQNIEFRKKVDEDIQNGVVTEERVKTHNPEYYSKLQDYINYDQGRKVQEDIQNGYVTEDRVKNQYPDRYKALQGYRKTLNRKVDFDCYIKPKSIMIEGPKRKFWVKWVLKKEQMLKSGKVYTEVLQFFDVACSNKTLSTPNVIYYGHRHTLVETDTSPSPSNFIIPDTWQEDISDFVCNYKKDIVTKLLEKINL
jgi:hypothetical protein